MGPKKGKKGKGSVAPPSEFESVPLEEIQEKIDLMKIELESSLKQRGTLQTEQDILKSIHQRKLSESRNISTLMLLKCHELEEVEMNHQLDIKNHERKLNFLKYEHNVDKKKVKDLLDSNIEEMKNDVISLESNLEKQKDAAYDLLKTLENTFQREAADTQKALSKNLSTIKANFQNTYEILMDDLSKKLIALEEALNLKEKVQLFAVTEAKNLHLFELVADHNKHYRDMKQFYDDVTEDNLNLINTLQVEIINLNMKNTHTENYTGEVQEVNQKMTAPANQSLAQLRYLNNKLRNKSKDELSFKNTVNHLRMLERKVSKKHEKCKAIFQKLEVLNKCFHDQNNTFKIELDKMQIQNESKQNQIRAVLEEKQSL